MATAQGARRARKPDGPLDGRGRRGHSSGLRKSSVGTMAGPGGRYAAYTTRLVDRVLAAPGHTPAELRRAVLARAARLSGTTTRASFPLSTTASPLDPLSTSWRGGTQE